MRLISNQAKVKSLENIKALLALALVIKTYISLTPSLNELKSSLMSFDK